MSESADTREDRQRLRILDAAGRCFASAGFKGTTIEDIATAAGLSRPVLYKHFEGKEALIDAVLDRAFDEWLASNEPTDASRGAGSLSAVEEIQTKIRQSVRFAETRPALRAILRQDPRVLVAGRAESFERCHESSLERTRSLLTRGRERGEIRSDLDLESMALGIEMMTFALVERAIGIRPDYPFSPALMDASIALLADGLRPRERMGGPDPARLDQTD